jgi:hypothetical protein
MIPVRNDRPLFDCESVKANTLGSTFVESGTQPQGIARRHELILNDSMKLGFLILLLSVAVAASKEIPNKSLTLTWDASPISDKVTGYRVYELVKSGRVLIGQSDTPHFVIPRKKGKHVYVVTAVSAKGESAPSTPLQVVPN